MFRELLASLISSLVSSTHEQQPTAGSFFSFSPFFNRCLYSKLFLQPPFLQNQKTNTNMCVNNNVCVETCDLVIFDSSLSFDTQVTKVVQPCFSQFRPFLPPPLFETVTQALISSRLLRRLLLRYQ